MFAIFVGRAGLPLAGFCLEPVGQQTFHRARPGRVELDRTVGIRPDADPFMRIAVQFSGLVQERAIGRRTAGTQDLEGDRLLQRGAQPDQLAPVLGKQALAPPGFLADKPLGKRRQRGEEAAAEGLIGQPEDKDAVRARSRFSTDAGFPEAVPFIGQPLNRALLFPIDEGEVALVFRSVTSHAERRAYGVPVPDARLGTLDIGTPGGSHQENGQALAVLDPLDDGLPERPEPLGQG